MTIKVGSDAHKELFCRRFLETHELYDPVVLPWPELDDAQLGRIRSVPFWQEVYHTERRAGAIVAAFTPMVQDPLVREAVALQGVEESRHARLLRVMIATRPSSRLRPSHRTWRPHSLTSDSVNAWTAFSALAPSRQHANRNSCPRACSRSLMC
jgi:hypothetical protein